MTVLNISKFIINVSVDKYLYSFFFFFFYLSLTDSTKNILISYEHLHVFPLGSASQLWLYS